MSAVLVYLGILAGIFFEGEMTMISSVIVGQKGYLNLSIVIALGITGTIASDVVYFFLGKKKGRVWLTKHPKYEKKAQSIFKKLNKAPLTVFISYRFLYGFRTVAPIIIGTSKISTKKFLTLSIISTLIWATTYSLLAYYLGDLIEEELSHIQHIEKYIIGGLVLLGITLLIFRWVKKNKKNNNRKA